jgi:hypothetical protein
LALKEVERQPAQQAAADVSGSKAQAQLTNTQNLDQGVRDFTNGNAVSKLGYKFQGEQLSAQSKERLVGWGRDFHNPRSAGYRDENLYHTRLMTIPEIANNLDNRKAMDGLFFQYSVNEQLIDGRISQSTADQLITSNWNKLATVNNWTDYETYQRSANSTLSSIGSNFSFTRSMSLSTSSARVIGDSLGVGRELEQIGGAGTTLLALRGGGEKGGLGTVGSDKEEGESITGESKEEKRQGGTPEPEERASVTPNPFLVREMRNVLAEDAERQDNSVAEARRRLNNRKE